MKKQLIISQLGEHNEIALMLSKRYDIKKVIILGEECKKSEFEALKKTYEELIPNCFVKFEYILQGEESKIKKILEDNKKENIIVNLTEGERINSLILLYNAMNLKIECVYVDLLKMKKYLFSDVLSIKEEVWEDASIKDITKLAGVKIISDSNKLSCKREVIEISKKIFSYLDIWNRYKLYLYDSKMIIHKDSRNIILNISIMDEKLINIINKVLLYLKNMNMIEYENLRGRIEVVFSNEYLKGFLFKVGTWLEVLTYYVISGIKDIDEVRSGLEFSWNTIVKNELDVVAIKDGILLCISCKDTDRYDEEALNELEVYSKKIGGEDAVKILVSTHRPLKNNVIERAKEMNINVVIADCGITKFKADISQIIKN